ncbi:MAG: LuxR C-terminal-related transcriptional regulator [Anaerolineaceae bacterium]
MTHVYFFGSEDELQVLDLPQKPEVIVRAINQGEWEHLARHKAAPNAAMQAMQTGKVVIVTIPQPPAQFPELSLSGKEYQVLQLFAAGYTYEQTAYEMHLQTRTVRTHASRLRNKLKVRSNTQLTALATALGLIHPDVDQPFI